MQEIPSYSKSGSHTEKLIIGFANIVRQTSTVSYNNASWNQGLLFEV